MDQWVAVGITLVAGLAVSQPAVAPLNAPDSVSGRAMIKDLGISVDVTYCCCGLGCGGCLAACNDNEVPCCCGCGSGDQNCYCANPDPGCGPGCSTN